MDAHQGGQGRHAVPDTDPHVRPARYLTHDQPPIGGVLKQRPEDFIVEELPLFALKGEGEHIYLFVEKRGLGAIDMINAIARHFRVRPDAVGSAGLKDRHAITRQLVSVHAPGKTPEDFPMLDREDMHVLWADLHTEKLKRGALQGNRFVIRLRGVEATSAIVADKVLERLAREGVPNRFGEQRFGYVGNNHLIGRAIVLRNYQEAVDRLLGPDERAPRSQEEARARYAAGDIEGAWKIFPRSFRTEQVVINALLKGKSPEAALRAVPKNVRSYYISAFQSAIFNAILDQRLIDATLDQLLPGDLAYHHEHRSTFAIDQSHLAGDPGDDAGVPAMLARFEISPSGPLWGREMTRPTGRAGEVELDRLRAFGLDTDDLDRADGSIAEMIGGARRPLRVPLTDPDVEGGMDEHGPYIKCAFELPRGAFATTVMEEVCKTRIDQGEERS